jgi:hypothetical protein
LIIGSMVNTIPLEPGVGRGARQLVVRHLRLGVKLPADAVADEVAHHRAALRLGVLLDGRADVADAAPSRTSAMPTPGLRATSVTCRASATARR